MTTTSSLKAGLLLVAINLVAGGCASQLHAPVIDKSPAAKQAAKPAKEKTVVKQVGGARPEFHIVQKGDTLYSIALAHDVDYKELAQWNNISDPTLISEGQQLRLTPSQDVAVTAPLQTTPGVEGKPVDSLGAKPLPATGMLKTEPKAVKLPYSDQALAQLQKSPALQAKIEPAPESRPESKVPEAVIGEIDWGWPATGKIVSGFSETANLKGVDIAGSIGQPVYASAPGRVATSSFWRPASSA